MFDSTPHKSKEQREVTLHDRTIIYTLKISKLSRAVRLAVYPDGSFVVTAPHKINEKVVEDFIIKKTKWIIEKIEHFKNNPRTLLPKHTVKEIKEYKGQASDYARLRLEHFNQFYNFSWKKVTIKNTKSRWGSCSKQGNLNFNYKIALLPPHLADYIVVHELCHLGELNHSPNFWKLVAKVMPNYKELRKKLKNVSL